MRSAFGVEHDYSEVEKANPLGALRTFGAGVSAATGKVGGGLASRSAGLGAKLRAKPGAATMGRSAGVGAAGLGQRGAGGLQRLSGGMAKRPGLTGGLAAGGATAGAGAAGLGMRKKQPGRF